MRVSDVLSPYRSTAVEFIQRQIQPSPQLPQAVEERSISPAVVAPRRPDDGGEDGPLACCYRRHGARSPRM
jgi:hypothetical protein